MLRIAATGDIHCRDSNREAVVASFAALGDDVDLVLVAGDLTSHGRLDEAEILCEAAAATAAPVYAVLGNHDWHADEAEAILERALDAAVLDDLPYLRIIHGKGTGALRDLVQRMLQRDPRVARFGLAPANQGGSGVTVVELV